MQAQLKFRQLPKQVSRSASPTGVHLPSVFKLNKQTAFNVIPATSRRNVRQRICCRAAAINTEHVQMPQGTSSGASPKAPYVGSEAFQRFHAAAQTANVVPLYERIFSDHLTPVLAYRCLVREDDVHCPSFLLESVVNGDTQGRYSFVGAMPAMEILATGNQVTVLDHARGTRVVSEEEDPMQVAERLSRNWKPAVVDDLPAVFTGGWVGYTGYDTVRYVYSGKLPFSSAPTDDLQLPDMQLALYNDVLVFDQATKMVYAISWVHIDEYASVDAAWMAGQSRLQNLVGRMSGGVPQLPRGSINMQLAARPASPGVSNMTKQEFLDAVQKTKEYIQAGDIFQLVLSQRFQRSTYAEPFEIYRALRVVNPSPYMVYMQGRETIIVSSSPEILCRVDRKRIVTNRPLAGTRRRGATPEEDKALETELLADEKETSEHVMLVDLGRNDVGKVSTSGSVQVEKLMEVERYSHVMHISSTVTGTLHPDLDCWDALRAALPAGTISGAPKVRAMQIIDELEVNKRGPYGGGVGFVSFYSTLDMALSLRTMVVRSTQQAAVYDYARSTPESGKPRREWVVNIQAGAGLVADSIPESEYEETINKAAALGRAIDLAEQAFL